MLKKNILFKFVVSIFIAGIVSGSLVYFTINTLEDDLILKNQVAAGNISRQAADSISFYLRARKEDIRILGSSLRKRLHSHPDVNMKSRSVFLKHGLNDFEMEFVRERFSCFYIFNQENKVLFALEKGKQKPYESVDNISLIKDLLKNGRPGKLFLKEYVKGRIVNSVSISENISLSNGENIILLGVISPETYAEILLKNRSRDYESSFIVSLKGEVVLQSGSPLSEKNFLNLLWVRNRIIEQGGSEVFIKDNKRFIISGTRIKEINSILCVIKPFSQFIGDIERIRNSVYLAGTAFFMVSFAVMIFIVQIITLGHKEKLIADSERKRAYQQKIYSTSLEEKNRELSNINETLEDLHNEIKDEKDKIERIVNSIEDIIIMINEDLKIDYINMSADKLIASEGDIKGSFLSQIQSMSWMIKPVMEVMKSSGNFVLKDEREIISPDNKKLVFQCSYIPIRSGVKKRITACMAVFRDVTATIELDRMKTEFISTVSHELRTPMAAVRGTVELMLAGTLGPINGEQENFLKVMLNETNRLIRLINNILDLQKAESGMISLDIESLDLDKLIRDCVDIIMPDALEKKLEVSCDVPEGLFIDTDSDKLRQIVLNLLNNAVKYTDNGKISLNVTADENKRHIRIKVSDTGRGIEQESLQRIFDRFYQADLNLTRKSGGTGLGLPITKELVRVLMGRIDVESEIGKGSAFTVEIPSFEKKDDMHVEYGRKVSSVDEYPRDAGSNENYKSSSGNEGHSENESLSGGECAFEEKPYSADKYHTPPRPEEVKTDISSILLIDDDESLCSVIEKALESTECRILTANTISCGLKMLTENMPFFIILDLGFPEGSGFDYISKIRQMCPSSYILILTGENDVKSASESIKAGADEYMLKPFEIEKLKSCLEKAEKAFFKRFGKVKRLMDAPKKSIERYFDASIIIGESIRMKEMKSRLKKIASSDETVLITGESGSGKELAARVIHLNSSRAGSPFIAINCGALSEKLLESELFGYVKGAFTGAESDKKGLFEAASGGTLFLDEIGEAPDKVQIRLLRVLQEKKVLPVGAVKAVDVNVRLLAATNRSLEKMVENSAFRKDLYFRLDVLNIKVPSLRERKDDIPLLVEHILNKNFEKYGLINVTPEYLKELFDYDWPGNIRELENVVKKSFLNSDNNILTPQELPEVFSKRELINIAGQSLEGIYKEEKAKMITLFDKIYFEDKLSKTKGNIRKAAKLSNMHTKNFYTKIKKAGIDPADYKES
jgi:DNA-binding NtrC family response regulator/signal transduction histidine kinase